MTFDVQKYLDDGSYTVDELCDLIISCQARTDHLTVLHKDDFFRLVAMSDEQSRLRCEISTYRSKADEHNKLIFEKNGKLGELEAMVATLKAANERLAEGIKQANAGRAVAIERMKEHADADKAKNSELQAKVDRYADTIKMQSVQVDQMEKEIDRIEMLEKVIEDKEAEVERLKGAARCSITIPRDNATRWADAERRAEECSAEASRLRSISTAHEAALCVLSDLITDYGRRLGIIPTELPRILDSMFQQARTDR